MPRAYEDLDCLGPLLERSLASLYALHQGSLRRPQTHRRPHNPHTCRTCRLIRDLKRYLPPHPDELTNPGQNGNGKDFSISLDKT